MPPHAWLATAHAAYLAVTGIWPLVHMRSFLAVTGPKQDLWLVHAAGVLIAAIACPIAVAAWRECITVEVFLLAVLSSLGLATIDVVYVARGTLRKVYLADASAQVLFLGGWLFIGPPAC